MSRLTCPPVQVTIKRTWLSINSRLHTKNTCSTLQTFTGNWATQPPSSAVLLLLGHLLVLPGMKETGGLPLPKILFFVILRSKEREGSLLLKQRVNRVKNLHRVFHWLLHQTSKNRRSRVKSQKTIQEIP